MSVQFEKSNVKGEQCTYQNTRHLFKVWEPALLRYEHSRCLVAKAVQFNITGQDNGVPLYWVIVDARIPQVPTQGHYSPLVESL